MRPIIIGSGLLGSSLFNRYQHNESPKMISFNGKVNSFTEEKKYLSSIISSCKDKNIYDCIINCRALANVDFCQENPNLAKYLNTTFPRLLADCSEALGIPLIHISTDHVYSGTSSFYKENEESPINQYGSTKYKGDILLMKSFPSSIVLRVNYVTQSKIKKNTFSDSIIERLLLKKPFFAFSDAIFTPVSISRLDRAIELCVKNRISGIYNLGSSNASSKYQFASMLAYFLGPQYHDLVVKSYLSDNKEICKRPLNLSMDSSLLENAIGLNHESIEDIVNLYFHDRQNS